jgi:hypothetical protein
LANFYLYFPSVFSNYNFIIRLAWLRPGTGSELDHQTPESGFSLIGSAMTANVQDFMVNLARNLCV